MTAAGMRLSVWTAATACTSAGWAAVSQLRAAVPLLPVLVTTPVDPVPTNEAAPLLDHWLQPAGSAEAVGTSRVSRRSTASRAFPGPRVLAISPARVKNRSPAA